MFNIMKDLFTSAIVTIPDNVSPDQYEKLLSEHEADVMRLQAQQKRELEKQMANLNVRQLMLLKPCEMM